MLSLILMTLIGATAADTADRGVSEALARERAAAIGALRYELAFTVPADRRQPVPGHALLRFALKTPHRIVLDLAEPRDRVRSIRVNGTAVTPIYVEDHAIVPEDATRAGENEITIEFTAGDAALNRNDDFLYTLFVPARAHLTFPCFDQPDLKARYTLSLDVPTGWETVANAPEVKREEIGRASCRERVCQYV